MKRLQHPIVFSLFLYGSLAFFLLCISSSTRAADTATVSIEKNKQTLYRSLDSRKDREELVKEMPSYDRDQIVELGNYWSQVYSYPSIQPDDNLIHAWTAAVAKFFTSERVRDEKFDLRTEPQLFKDSNGFHEVLTAWFSLSKKYRKQSQDRIDFENKLRKEFLLKLFGFEYGSDERARHALQLLGGDRAVKSFDDRIEQNVPYADAALIEFMETKVFSEIELVEGLVDKINSDSKLAGINLENRERIIDFETKGYLLSDNYAGFMITDEVRVEKPNGTRGSKKRIKINEFRNAIRANHAKKDRMIAYLEALEFLSWRLQDRPVGHLIKEWRENVGPQIKNYDSHELLRVFKVLVKYSSSETWNFNEASDNIGFKEFVSRVVKMLVEKIDQLDKSEFLSFIQYVNNLGWFDPDLEQSERLDLDVLALRVAARRYLEARQSEFHAEDYQSLTKLVASSDPKRKKKKTGKKKKRDPKSSEKVVPERTEFEKIVAKLPETLSETETTSLMTPTSPVVSEADSSSDSEFDVSSMDPSSPVSPSLMPLNFEPSVTLFRTSTASIPSVEGLSPVDFGHSAVKQVILDQKAPLDSKPGVNVSDSKVSSGGRLVDKEAKATLVETRLAERNLAMSYWPKNKPAAIKMYEQASDHGDPVSSYKLFVIYKGMSKPNLAKAIYRLKLAAMTPISSDTPFGLRQIVVSAQRELGIMYQLGLVPNASQVDRDLRSTFCLKLAASNGDEIARTILANENSQNKKHPQPQTLAAQNQPPYTPPNQTTNPSAILIQPSHQQPSTPGPANFGTVFLALEPAGGCVQAFGNMLSSQPQQNGVHYLQQVGYPRHRNSRPNRRSSMQERLIQFPEQRPLAHPQLQPTIFGVSGHRRSL